MKYYTAKEIDNEFKHFIKKGLEKDMTDYIDKKYEDLLNKSVRMESLGSLIDPNNLGIDFSKEPSYTAYMTVQVDNDIKPGNFINFSTGLELESNSKEKESKMSKDVEVKHWDNGNIKNLTVYNGRQFHNHNGPAYQLWDDENGQEKLREYWVDGYLHNESGPAVQMWAKNGQEIKREYRIYEKRHNESGPALQRWYGNGQERIREYWIDGYLHNESGPAIQLWYANGKEEEREYWINGEQLSEKEFYNRKNKVKLTVNGTEKYISKESAEELNLI